MRAPSKLTGHHLVYQDDILRCPPTAIRLHVHAHKSHSADRISSVAFPRKVFP